MNAEQNPFNYPFEHLLAPANWTLGNRKVPVDLGDGKISTMLESDLLRLSGVHEDDNEHVHWVQYHLPANGQMVHRSVHLHLKKACLPIQGEAAVMG